jgi:hypothetical protein
VKPQLTGTRTAPRPIEAVRVGPDRLSLIGSAIELHQQIQARRSAGMLLRATDLAPTGDGRFVTTITVTREPRPYRPVPATLGRREVVGTAVVAGGWMVAVAVALLVVVALLALLWQLRLYVLGGAGVIIGLWILLGRIGVCPGVHCPGCRHS